MIEIVIRDLRLQTARTGSIVKAVPIAAASRMPSPTMGGALLPQWRESTSPQPPRLAMCDVAARTTLGLFGRGEQYCNSE